jgi:pimeloyl-ACP methyl ester carboxylesterase
VTPESVPESAPFGRGWTSRDGLRLFYRDYPGIAERPPLVCLSGLTRNSRDFADFAERYAGRFRVIAPDFRGRGLSDRDPQPERYNPKVYAADILQLLDELGVDRAVFVGTSLGGIVAMLIAATHPQRVAGTILNDIGPDLDLRGLDRIRNHVGRPVGYAEWDEAARRARDISGGLPASNTHEDWLRVARRLFTEDGDAIILDYDMAIAQVFNPPKDEAQPAFDMWPLYRALGQSPLLIVRGEASDLLSVEAAAAMLDAIPGAELVTVSGVGHPPDLTEPAATAAIDAFLARFDQAPAGS